MNKKKTTKEVIPIRRLGWLLYAQFEIIENVNRFRCIDEVIESAKPQLSEKFIKHLQFILKPVTSGAKKDWFAVGNYKKLPNEVGGRKTTLPEQVSAEMKRLHDEYNGKKTVTLEDILAFHVRFERIHPFRDGNGRIGRLIMFKECLKHNILDVLFRV